MKTPFITLRQVEEITNSYPTPFVIYDAQWIQDNMKYVDQSFNKFFKFKNYFAVKACPNPTILKLLKQLWSGADCSSLGELVLSELCGITWEDIMFTSNNTQAEEFIKADSLWAIINFDDINHIPFYLEKVWHMPQVACCRYNPGSSKQWNDIIWEPEEAKYGMTRNQILEAYKLLKENWVIRFWLHIMVASNELDPQYFIETAEIIFKLLVEIEQSIWIQFEFVNLWGWIWIPYLPEQQSVDLEYIASWIQDLYKKIISNNTTREMNIYMECGRMITWPFGLLITKTQHITKKYKNYVWVDASMQCLMRSAMYGSYHHISVLWKENHPLTEIYDITWSLCENNDKFAINRSLPNIEAWDYLAIHDAGAHWTAMWFNYNATLRPAELLLDQDWNVQLIRRAETLHDYFSTVQWINWFEY